MIRLLALACLTGALAVAGCAPRSAAEAPAPALGDAVGAPTPELGAFRVFRGDGRPARTDAVGGEIDLADVLVLQTEPGDSIGTRVARTLLSDSARRTRRAALVSWGAGRIPEPPAPGTLVVHSVASASAEPLAEIDAYRRDHPGARVLSVRIRRVADPADFEPSGPADFVILTRR